MHVVQFFLHLRPRPHIEVVVAPLPEPPQPVILSRKAQRQLPLPLAFLPAHALRKPLFEDLNHFRGLHRSRLADQQMHVLRHEHVPDQPELKFASDFPQHFQEQISRANCFQIPPPVVATKRNEMKVALAVVAFQTFRHNATHRSGPPLQKPQG